MSVNNSSDNGNQLKSPKTKVFRLSKKSAFSRINLGVFVLLFIVIGGIVFLSSKALNPNLPGDVNGDNIVDITDVSMLLGKYGTSYPAGDFNNSGLIEIGDLSVVLSNYGKSYSASLSISPNSLPSGTQGTTYSQTISTSGGSNGPYSLRVTQGTLPTGISFDGSNLSGTPTVSGTFAFTISAFDKNNTYVLFKDYSLTINPGSTPPPPPPSGTWPPVGAYFYDDFLNGWTKWSTEGTSSSFSIVDDGSGGKALSLTVTPTSSGPNASSELASVFLGADKAHSGYQKTNEDTWYRHGIRFPSSGYTPTTGEWNWLVEWHTDTKTQQAGGNSTSLGVLTDYPVTTNPGSNPRLNLRIGTGSSSSPTYKYFSLPSNSLKYNYWYDSVYHIVWSTDASIGLFEWWIDGQQIASYKGPTLYRNSDGTISYNTFGLYNYRLHASWSSSVHFKKVVLGPTRASVGF